MEAGEEGGGGEGILKIVVCFSLDFVLGFGVESVARSCDDGGGSVTAPAAAVVVAVAVAAW